MNLSSHHLSHQRLTDTKYLAVIRAFKVKAKPEGYVFKRKREVVYASRDLVFGMHYVYHKYLV